MQPQSACKEKNRLVVTVVTGVTMPCNWWLFRPRARASAWALPHVHRIHIRTRYKHDWSAICTIDHQEMTNVHFRNDRWHNKQGWLRPLFNSLAHSWTTLDGTFPCGRYSPRTVTFRAHNNNKNCAGRFKTLILLWNTKIKISIQV